MPGFFQFLHGVLPLPAAGEALRSVLYFDGNGLGAHLLVAGRVDRGRRCALPAQGAQRSGNAIPARPAGPRPRRERCPRSPAGRRGPSDSGTSPWPAFPLAILVVVVGAMSFSMHKPEPHDIPVVVVAATPEGQQAAAGLDAQLERHPRRHRRRIARPGHRAINARDVVAAFVLPPAPAPRRRSTRRRPPTPASSPRSARSSNRSPRPSRLPLTLTDVTAAERRPTPGQQQHLRRHVVDHGRLPVPGRPARRCAAVRRLRQFLPLLAGWAVGMSVWLWFLFDVLIGAISGNALELIGFGAPPSSPSPLRPEFSPAPSAWPGSSR